MNEIIVYCKCGCQNKMIETSIGVKCKNCGNFIKSKFFGILQDIDNNGFTLSSSFQEICNDSYYSDLLKIIRELISDGKLHYLHLNLINDKLTSLDGIDILYDIKFRTIDCRNTKLKVISDLPQFINKAAVEFFFMDCVELTHISEKAINKINNLNKVNLYFHLENTPKFDLNSLSKIDFYKICDASDFGSAEIYTTNVDFEIPLALKKLGFEKLIFKKELDDSKQGHNEYAKWVYKKKKEKNRSSEPTQKLQNKKIEHCFIATVTMGSYDNAMVLELRHLRDNFILKKSWGREFVNSYYKYGKIAAKKIESNLFLKFMSFILVVAPLYLISKMITKFYGKDN
jgi:hypothetical protein